jgi:hypothetical protein
MKNTLTDLNNYLFEALERLQDDDLDDAGLDKELKRCDATVKVADAIIHNGELALKTMQHMDDYGLSGKDTKLAPMLTAKGE